MIREKLQTENLSWNKFERGIFFLTILIDLYDPFRIGYEYTECTINVRSRGGRMFGVREKLQMFDPEGVACLKKDREVIRLLQSRPRE